MNKKFNKLFAFLLSLTMLVSIFPAGAMRSMLYLKVLLIVVALGAASIGL